MLCNHMEYAIGVLAREDYDVIIHVDNTRATTILTAEWPTSFAGN